MNIGDLAIKAATLLAIVAFVEAWRWARGREGSERTFRLAYHAMTALLVFAGILLMRAILVHDFRFEYVIDHSSRELPLLYLVSAFWAGQEGTFLLWAVLAALIGYPLLRRRAWEPATVAACYVPTVGFLLVFMLDSGGNPFRLAEAIPPDGRGLNILLQDPWMATHPPVVFLGYAAMTVPAVLAIASLLLRRNREWLGPALRWSLVGFVSLGLGIILGGFWAYKVLGWGGYWGWDPVENASLVPWLAVTALIHGLIVQMTTGSLRRINLGLGLAGYALVIYATFLTRSGVLADVSVHSFPPGTLYKLLLGVLLFVVAVSVAVFVGRRVDSGKKIPVETGWPFVLSAVLLLFAVSAGVVLMGTSWPILSSAIGQAETMEGPFYNRTSMPLYMMLLGLLAAGPFLAWHALPWKMLARRLALPLLVAVAGTAVAAALGGAGVPALVLFFLALAALTSNVERFVRMAQVRFLACGAALAHMGFALMFVGIVGSSMWGTSERLELPLGEPVEAVGATFVYGGHVDGSEPEDRWRVAVSREGKPEAAAEVAIFRVPGQPGAEPQVFKRPAILRGAAQDLYIAPLGIDPGARERHLDLHRDHPVEIDGGSLTFLAFERGEDHENTMEVIARVRLQAGEEEEILALPLHAQGGHLHGEPVDASVIPGLRLTFEDMAVEQGRIHLMAEREHGPAPFLVAELSTKPLINVLWAGTIFLLAGCTVAIVRRVSDERRLASVTPAGRPQAPTVVRHPSKKPGKKAEPKRASRKVVGGRGRSARH
jgi:cytochrome c-type biogenesis protein CcmF